MNNKIGFQIQEEINRVDASIIDKLRKYDTTLLADGANARVWMEHSIKPIEERMKIVGQAITVKLTLGDSLLVSKAVDVAKPGDVIVIDGAGTSRNALWGDMKSLSCKHKGLEGAVIDGAFRDLDGCREIGFPLFAKYVIPGSSTKNSLGEINIPINCGGVIVNPGDIVVGDNNGVVVLPYDRIDEIIENAEKKVSWVEQTKAEILKGKYVSGNFSKKMKELGYE